MFFILIQILYFWQRNYHQYFVAKNTWKFKRLIQQFSKFVSFRNKRLSFVKTFLQVHHF